MKKRLLSILLTFCLALTLLPTVALAANATSVYVGAVELNSTTPYLVGSAAAGSGTLGSDGCTAQFDAGTGTLTLNGANITTAYEEANSTKNGIYANGSLSIVLVGENTVTGVDTSAGYSYGVDVIGTLAISGSGSLTATGGKATAPFGRSYGIYAQTLEINSGTVTATGGTDSTSSFGIYANNHFTISGSAQVTANGSPAGNESWGIISVNGPADSTISGSAKVTANGGSVGSYSGCSTRGIGVSTGNLTISETAQVNAFSGNGYSSKGINVNTSSYNINIKDSAVVIAKSEAGSAAMAMAEAPTLADYTGVYAVTVSANSSGTPTTAYSAENISSYKYIQINPIIVVVTEEELKAAITNVVEGGTIALGNDITLTGKLGIISTKSFTIDLNSKTLDSGTNTAIDHQGNGTLTITGGKVTSANTSTKGTIALTNSASLIVVDATVENTKSGYAINYSSSGSVSIDPSATITGNLSPLTAAPTATTTSVAKTSPTQASVSFSLTNSPAYTSGITWKVYDESTGDSLVSGVTASNTGNTLTLAHETNLPARTYNVAAYDRASGTGVSLRLALTVANPTVSTVATSSASSISSTGATLNGTVKANNSDTTVTFEYGTTAAYGLTATAVQSPVTGDVNTSVSTAITGLTPNTTYHYRVVGVNVAGTTYGADQTFTTLAMLPTVTTSAANSISSTGATLNGTVNANNSSTAVTFEYGTTVTYGSTASAAPSPVTGTEDTSVSKIITGLMPNTTYHYRVVGVNNGGTANGADQTFTTSTSAPGAPTIGTATAGDSQATVSFTAPVSNGGLAITGYTVTSNSGGITATGAGSPITVTGLTNGVAYTFTVTATNNVGTSTPSAQSNSVTPQTQETMPAATIDYVNEALTNLTSGAAYAVNSADVAADGDGKIAIQNAWLGTTISLVKKGNGTTTANSAVQSVTLAARPAAPSCTALQPSASSATGTVSGITTAMQYSTNGSTSWIDGTGADVTGLNPGTVLVRVKATPTTPAGLSQSITITAYTAPPSSGGGSATPAAPVTEIKNGGSTTSSNIGQLVSGGKTLTVDGDKGAKLVFNTEALKGIDGQTSGSIKVEMKDVSPAHQENLPGKQVFSLTVSSGGSTITNFGGSVTVTLPYALKDRETANEVTVWYLANGGTMTEIPCTYDAATGLATFTVNHFSLYVVGVGTPWVNPFTDVSENDWFYGAVKFANQNGLFAGTGADTFSPKGPMTRAMLWTVLARLDGQSLSGSGVFDAARLWAMSAGITDGTNPDGCITREQMVTILWRYAGSPKTDGDLSKFYDAGSVASYAADAMAWAVENGIMAGSNSGLMPQENATRAQVAAILQRFIEATAK